MPGGNPESGLSCRLFLCAKGKLGSLPATAEDFTELTIVDNTEVDNPTAMAVVPERFRFNRHVAGKETLGLSFDLACVGSDPGYLMLLAAKNAARGSDAAVIGVVSSVGDPNEAGNIVTYGEFLVENLPRSEGNDEAVSGQVSLALAARSNVVPKANHVATAGMFWGEGPST